MRRERTPDKCMNMCPSGGERERASVRGQMPGMRTRAPRDECCSGYHHFLPPPLPAAVASAKQRQHSSPVVFS